MTLTNMELREQVAACTRLMVPEGIIDFSGHVSARIPGSDHMLIQPRLVGRSVLRPEDLLVADLDGNLVEGDGELPSETALHTGVYRARPDAHAVCHGHPLHSTVFSTVDVPMRPMRNFAQRIADGVPVHRDGTHIRSQAQGEELAKTLGDHLVCLLRGHGTVVVGGSVKELFSNCLDLEENAKAQIQASMVGTPLPFEDDEIEALRASFGSPSGRASKIWNHYLEKGAHYLW
ncbi:class II aldolase/adducin family protein [Egicoccus halophilus]|uniref:Class II aldolase n=1 Tax=Egicoccus halophilus TaxID=1670830 RepID=A0A8J3A912_9ACTN|nr:class II aldolase/adducin family protein [Egicoccus halophilus]GGI07528.1 class II aldolase [Egicoccus halophilus]